SVSISNEVSSASFCPKTSFIPAVSVTLYLRPTSGSAASQWSVLGPLGGAALALALGAASMPGALRWAWSSSGETGLESVILTSLGARQRASDAMRGQWNDEIRSGP